MSNYPPGVTGNEPMIAGVDDREFDVQCRVPGASALTISVGALRSLEAIRSRGESLSGASLRGIIHAIEEVEFTECPFEGNVAGWVEHGVRYWTCPVCRSEHEDEMDDRDPDLAWKERFE